jgi:DNA invertase Pin-like site-specific DNA recombinase
MTKTLIPAVGYARRSTDMQERSIPDQQAAVERWAGENGYRVLRWFIDDAVSGTSARGRDAFEQMMKAAENGRDFETVLCYDISRFSRGGTNETGFYLHRLHLAGVGVVFTADGIPEGDEGELIQGVKSWQARQYSVKLARDSIRGQISNIRERKSAPGGMAPYGYDKQHLTGDGQLLRTLRWMPDGSKQEFGPDGRLLRVIPAGVNLKKAKSDIIRYVPSLPERVATIRRMFDLCVQGYGFHHIAQTFNAEGIPSPGGQKWNTARIAKLIRNPVYRGAVVWNRHTMGSLFGLDGEGKLKPKRKKMWQRNAEADWIISECVHEALVSKDVWEAAQRSVAKRRAEHGNARPTKRTLLAGLLVCKRCGNPFTTIRDRRWPGPTGEGYRSYTCSGYHRYGKSVCRVVNVPGPALDRFVLDAVRKVLLGDHATVEKAVDAFVKAVLVPRAKAKPTRGDERELDLLNRKIKATVSMLADPTFDGLDELRTTLADLKAKRDVLEARLKPTEEPAMPTITEADLRSWAAEQFARLDELATRTDIDLADRQMIAAFVEKIEVNPETKTGVVYLHTGLERAFSDGSTRLPGGDFMGAFEIAFYGWKEGAGHLFLGPNNVTDLWHVKKVNPQSMIHLTEKPVELAVRAMQYSSREGEHVLDLFGGSGSTLIAAEQTNRKAFLMELDPLYADVIVTRWEQFTGRKAERIAAPQAALPEEVPA